MKELIQKEIIRKPIYPHGEDINGRMESETTIVQILGVTVFKKVIQLFGVTPAVCRHFHSYNHQSEECQIRNRDSAKTKRTEQTIHHNVLITAID